MTKDSILHKDKFGVGVQTRLKRKANPDTEAQRTDTQVSNDEVLEYQKKRYVSVAEGCWRLRKNEIAERKPAMM